MARAQWTSLEDECFVLVAALSSVYSGGWGPGVAVIENIQYIFLENIFEETLWGEA